MNNNFLYSINGSIYIVYPLFVSLTLYWDLLKIKLGTCHIDSSHIQRTMDMPFIIYLWSKRFFFSVVLDFHRHVYCLCIYWTTTNSQQSILCFVTYQCNECSSAGFSRYYLGFNYGR